MELAENIQDLIDDFAFLDDWEDRYMHVIEMGKALTPLSPSEQNDENKVSGCVSQVWLVHELRDGKLYFRGDSDAHIVKGLVAIVLEIFSGRTPQDIRALDAESIIKNLGLAEHLSTQRANGLKSMIARIQNTANELL
ncbi:MAG TPA: SufE family protein [Hellea balneolensis]|uniref:SufE family protein n=1 Tax=Hellea balneolensis TaxID=287478 RepID=A0A7C5LYB0_9PROT|nr:SufE family protein [Hellea balneolensis]